MYAVAGEDAETYERHIAAVVASDPQIIMDDGADLDTALHTKFTDKLAGVIGGTEETTTGVVRLMAMAAEGALGYPVFNINDANTKHCFDNHYGTGQSTLDGIVRATNRLLCGRTIVDARATATAAAAWPSAPAAWAWTSSCARWIP